MDFYKFEEPLTEGTIIGRPNRFLMDVKINKEVVRCHCPSTGRIGDIVFKDIACLLSRSKNKERKTPYTVEAISLDPLSKKDKDYIGINQVKMNDYVDFFLKKGRFSKVVGKEKILRERKLGNSRIDFLVGKTYLEVKMPLIILPSKNSNKKEKQSKFNSFDRLIKHFEDLSKSLRNNYKAVILLSYVYDAKPFSPPKKDATNSRIIKAAKDAHKKGVETWQANFKIDKKGVYFRKLLKLNLFS
ncbi:MAG: DNA/RNA nuclease SfsA [Nanoarchaeota archaeon]|nr:DNA/RNA nuclease SfsA [Nanoarchaeota archaeon]